SNTNKVVDFDVNVNGSMSGLDGRKRAMPQSSASSQSDANSAIRQSEPLTFRTADGFPIGGTLFKGVGSGPLVLISSATAVPQQLYHRFALRLIDSGARAVLCYDYRGTGHSPRPAGW